MKEKINNNPQCRRVYFFGFGRLLPVPSWKKYGHFLSFHWFNIGVVFHSNRFPCLNWSSFDFLAQPRLRSPARYIRTSTNNDHLHSLDVSPRRMYGAPHSIYFSYSFLDFSQNALPPPSLVVRSWFHFNRSESCNGMRCRSWQREKVEEEEESRFVLVFLFIPVAYSTQVRDVDRQ